MAGALPRALAKLGHDVAVFFPLYRLARRNIANDGATLQDTGAICTVQLGNRRVDSRWLQVHPPAHAQSHESGSAGSLTVYALDCPSLFDRDGLYGHDDDCARFSTFSRGVLASAAWLMRGPPNVFHCHDWHSALIPVFLRGAYRARLPNSASVLTIHNLAYQGVFPAEMLPLAGFGPEAFHPELLEFHGRQNWLKAGIASAQAITTVSPRYADEIRTPAFGERLDGVLRAHGSRLVGIVNGIDTDLWNPQNDHNLISRFSRQDLSGKRLCRRHLLEMARMDPDDPRPVVGIVSRFAAQKGLDLVAELVPYLAGRGVRILLLGQGEPAIERWFQHLEAGFGQHVRVQLAHDPVLAHQVLAGADMTLMPSRYEPCGLSQLYSLRFGTIPVVRGVGGLVDTVVPLTPKTLSEGTATGFVFEHDTLDGLRWAMDQAMSTFYERPAQWQALQRNGMAQDLSWRLSAQKYEQVFRFAVDRAGQ